MNFKVIKSNKRDYDFSKEQIEYIVNQYKADITTNEIGNEFGVSYKTIARLLSREGVELTGVGKRKYKLNQNYFDEINTPNKAYILGLLFADGCNYATKETISISLQEEDRDILEAIRNEIGSEKPLEYIDYSNKNDGGYHYKNQYRLLVFSKHMCDKLSDIGMIPNKSLQLHFPNIPDNLYRHFIRGYYDGDGSFTSHYSKSGKFQPLITITSTENFCNKTREILINELNIPGGNVYDASCHNGVTRVLSISGANQTKAILDWFYADADLYMERKYQKYLDAFGIAV